jgi:arsenite methyltransferase
MSHMAARDLWADWLAEGRFGGDPEIRRHFSEELAQRTDKVLDYAELAEGETLLNVGCGEGLIGFRALERGAGAVIFGDVSQDLLDFCREAATRFGTLDRCRFVRAYAENLASIDDGSIDVVTTRSVLIYVADKASAFREFVRVLRPGGRISLFEPINRFARPAFIDDTWIGYDTRPIREMARKLRAVYEEIQPPDTDPMLNFDERDLLDLAEGVGFFPIHMNLEVEFRPCEPRTWEGFLNTSGNPRIPTLAEAMRQALAPDEREAVIQHLRPLVEAGRGTWRMASAHHGRRSRSGPAAAGPHRVSERLSHINESYQRERAPSGRGKREAGPRRLRERCRQGLFNDSLALTGARPCQWPPRPATRERRRGCASYRSCAARLVCWRRGRRIQRCRLHRPRSRGWFRGSA